MGEAGIELVKRIAHVIEACPAVFLYGHVEGLLEQGHGVGFALGLGIGFPLRSVLGFFFSGARLSVYTKTSQAFTNGLGVFFSPMPITKMPVSRMRVANLV